MYADKVALDTAVKDDQRTANFQEPLELFWKSSLNLKLLPAEIPISALVLI